MKVEKLIINDCLKTDYQIESELYIILVEILLSNENT